MELSSGSLSYTVMIDLPDSRPGNGAKFILGVESAGVGQADASVPHSRAAPVRSAFAAGAVFEVYFVEQSFTGPVLA